MGHCPLSKAGLSESRDPISYINIRERTISYIDIRDRTMSSGGPHPKQDSRAGTRLCDLFSFLSPADPAAACAQDIDEDEETLCRQVQRTSL